MRRIYNIKLKEDRPKAILAIKKAIGCNLSEAKELVKEWNRPKIYAAVC